MKQKSSANIGDEFVSIGEYFVNKPYKAKLLEQKPEQLSINLSQFDCYTLVENTIALALCKKSNQDFDFYKSMVQKLRYRNNKIDGFFSRHHYLTEWTKNLEASFEAKNITKDFAGFVKTKKQINYISKHSSKYQFDEKSDFSQFIALEKKLSQLEFFYLPKNKVKLNFSKFKNGDIVCIATKINGLDYSHLGFVKMLNGIPHLLHASSDYKKVMISKQNLHEYLKINQNILGLTIFRFEK